MPKVTQLEGSGAEITVQVCLVSKPDQPPSRWLRSPVDNIRGEGSRACLTLRITSQEESCLARASLPPRALHTAGKFFKWTSSLFKPAPSPRRHKCPFSWAEWMGAVPPNLRGDTSLSSEQCGWALLLAQALAS